MKISLIVTKRPTLKKPVMICAWPGLGEVAFKLGLYLRDKLKMQEFASLEAKDLFPPNGVWVEKDVIQMPNEGLGKFYFLKNKFAENDLILFLSDAQPLIEKAYPYCRKILSLAKEFMVRRIMTFASMPQPIDYMSEPQVWFSATSRKLIEEFNSLNMGLKLLSGGQVSGLNGLILGFAKYAGLEGVCLLGEIPLFSIQAENPKTVLAILKKLNKILNINADPAELARQAKMMEDEIEKIIDMIHSPEKQSAPIGEEEIERIKKTLGFYTKLPRSGRERIDKLFLESRVDISRANALKKELDHWNVYKDYEDKFLDLFKKPKGEEEKKNG